MELNADLLPKLYFWLFLYYKQLVQRLKEKKKECCFQAGDYLNQVYLITQHKELQNNVHS